MGEGAGGGGGCPGEVGKMNTFSAVIISIKNLCVCVCVCVCVSVYGGGGGGSWGGG